MSIAGENSAFTLVRCEDTEGWLAQRTKGIGGSDVAAIMGLSPWHTPVEAWLEKTGGAQPDDISDKPYVQFGNIMEPIIGKWYADQHPERTVRRVNAICKSKERPWAQASLDYEVRDGEWGVLEIKTARTASDWADGVPPYYLTQIAHYMSVTGRTFADVAVFFRDTCEFAEYRVCASDIDVAAIEAVVDDFWLVNVQGGAMPEVTGAASETAALTAYYGQPQGDFVEASDPETDEAIAIYLDAAEREKQAKAEKSEASARLMSLIGENKGLVTSTAKVTWVRSMRETFDQKGFKADHPDIWAEYAQKKVCNGGIRIKEVR